MKKQKFLSKKKLVKTTTITMALLIAATLISSSAVSVTTVSNTTNVNAKSTNPIKEFSVATDMTTTEDKATGQVMEAMEQSMLDWLHYDDGTCENALGLTAGGELEEAIRLTPTELAGYNGYEIQKVRVMHGWPGGTPQPSHNAFVRIYDAGTTTTPGALAKEQAFVAPAGNDWVEVDLLDPYVIDETQDVWVSVAFTHVAGEFPCGFDTDTVVPDKGGFLTYTGAGMWFQLHEIGFPGCWNLWAGLEVGGVFEHDVGVLSIEEPSSGDAGVITPEVKVKNYGNYTETTDVQLTIGQFAPPVTLLSEDFESGYPGWTIVDGFGDGVTWIPDSGSTSGGVSGTYMNADSDANYGYWLMEELISPSIDCSAAMSVLLDFAHYYNHLSSAAYVDVSNNGGMTWNNVATYNTGDVLGPTTIDITAEAAGYSDVKIRFLYDDQNVWAWWWYVDNVEVYQLGGLVNEYDETVSVTVPVNETVDVTFPAWTPDDWQVSENVDITYECIATTLLVDDNPANDQKTKSVTLHYPYLHDIAVLSIDSPIDDGPAQTLPVQCTIKNVGQFPECCYKTNMQIGERVYTDAWYDVIWSGTGEWMQHQYGTGVYYEPVGGSGDYFMGCESDGSGTPFDTSLYTFSMDFTGLTTATLEYWGIFQDYAGSGYAEINTYSGGFFEEQLWWRTTDEYPRVPSLHTYTMNVGGYFDPSDVTIEFYYTDMDGAYSGNAWGWYLDDVTIPEIGYYEDFEGIFPPADFIVMTEYNEDICTILLNPGEEATLTYPDWTPDALALLLSGPRDYEVIAEQQLSGDTNPANDMQSVGITLEYWHDVLVEEITAPSGDKSAPGDVLWHWNAEVGNDNQILGIEWDGDYFYITGAGGTTGGKPNSVYRFEYDGTFVDEVVQGTTSSWGWRDIAYDGTHMYSSDSYDVVEWSITGPPGSPVLNIHNTYVGVSPVNPARALAYDPATGHFWTASFSSDYYEFDLTGTVHNTFSNPWSGAYGMAWDDLCGSGPYLWVHDQGGSGTDMHQVDPTTGMHTGLTYTYIPGTAGGLCMIDEDGLGQLVGINQGTPDEAFSIEICETGPPGAPDPDIWIQPGTESIEVLVENAGTFPETGMNVNAKIYEYITNVSLGILVYEENYTCGTIDPLGGQETATFPAYTFPDIAGIYRLEILITPTDDYPDNNEMDLGIAVDNVPPTSQHTLTPATPDGLNGWYVSDVTVDFTADDGTEDWQSGVDHIEYRVNGGSWQTGTTVTVTTDGEHTVDYKAIDKVGNEETPNSVDFKIDQTIPNVDLTWESPDNVHVDFTATCSDDTSGMDYVEFYLNLGLMFTDNDEPYEWSIVWSPSLKTAVFTAKAFDQAGLFNTDEVSGIEAFPYPHSHPYPKAQDPTTPL